MNAADADNIVIIGMPGAGKSAAGRALARLSRRPFVETDEMTAAAAGMPVSAIFAEYGEARFRALESAALKSALQKKRQVISTGGGIIMQKENRELIRGAARALYLCAPPFLLARRLKADPESRPLLAGKNLADSLAELLAQREPLYQQTAQLTVMQHEHDTPADVARKARAGLRHLPEQPQ